MLSPAFKYFYGRLTLFVICMAILFPFPLNILVKAMIALVVSAGAGYFLLARWRNEMGAQLEGVAGRRKAEKDRLRAALAGDEDAIAAGDRVAAVTKARSKSVKKDDEADESEPAKSDQA